MFAGTPDFAVPCLEALINSTHEILAIYTQPDRPAGRGRQLQSSAVKQCGVTHHIPVYQPHNFKNEESIKALQSLKPDLMVVIAYGLILPKTVLSIPNWGCINVHASLLPRWRGASPIQHALLQGDTVTGVTIMQMNQGLDTGDMLASNQCEIFPTDTAKTLHDRLAKLAPELLISTINNLFNHRIKPVPQNSQDATYAGKIEKENALINWNSKALDISNQIRAYNPWPIAYAKINSEVLRIYQAQVVTSNQKALAGTILSIDKQGILVATKDDALLVQTIQFSGGRVLSIAEWLNGKKEKLKVGMVFQ